MKRIFTIITLLAIIIFAGCTNLDDVYRQLDEQERRLTALKARLKTLEELKDNTNSEITTIKTLIEAVNKKISVVSYRELDDKSGYELTMSDESKITLKHGAKGVKGDPGKKGEQGEKGDDGITPAINVKRHTDGLLYWTINGEWLRDANGNMVPAEGKDGEDGKPGAPGANGITPLLQINADFYWEVSFDEGKTWKPVIGADGKPVLAQGPKGEPGQDGDANLTITETDDVVIIVYRGVTYVISKSVPPPSMTFTTAKAPGGTLRLLIAAAEVDQPDVWIDLNNNGNEDEGEKVTRFSQIANYPFTNQTITIYGKVSELICFGNELTALDVSNNAELVSLLCMKNRLTELNVINNTKLQQLQCFENQISGDKMTELVNSLPDRSGMEEGIFRMINLDTPEEGNSITASDVAIATGKNWSVEDAYANPYTLEQPKVVLTTAKDIGETIILEIDAAEADRADVWIDLNNNGDKDPGEAVTLFDTEVDYTLKSKTITIYGKIHQILCSENDLTTLDVSKNTELIWISCWGNQLTALDVSKNTKLTELDCDYNQISVLDVSDNTELEHLYCSGNRLTTLDVTKNTKLKTLYCSGNKISGNKMTALVNSLPDRKGKEEGTFRVINPTSPDEGNDITADQIATATAKNWSVLDYLGNPYTPQGNVPNPLSYVAEYNVNTVGDGFVTSLTDCTVSGYFNFDDAVSKFSDITISGKQYHLPSIEEWRSIVPKSLRHVQFTKTESYDDISETVMVQGTSITMTSDFRTGVNGVSYALRYKGTDMVSAWRYEYISDGNNTHMKVTSRSLKGQTVVTVEEIAKPAFWSTNAGNDVTRHFPASGYFYSSSLGHVGTYGYFWSSSPFNSSFAWSMYFYSSNVYSGNNRDRILGFSVRLFSSGD